MTQTWSTDESFALLAGLDSGELFLDYQPLFDLSTSELVGVEALVRWQHPQRGVVGPAGFLPFAQHRSFADRLNTVVVNDALAQHRAWRKAGHVVPVSINIGPNTFVGPTSLDAIRTALDRFEVEPHLLTIEVTETEADHLNAQIGDSLIELSRLGVRLSLDDFGTGHASLSRLRHWHFDELKIDRTFVERITTDPTDRKIVAFSTQLGRALGMVVVAEGVPDDAAVDMLCELGVDRGQGFHLGRPAPATDLDTSRLRGAPGGSTNERV